MRTRTVMMGIGPAGTKMLRTARSGGPRALCAGRAVEGLERARVMQQDRRRARYIASDQKARSRRDFFLLAPPTRPQI